MVFTAEQIRLWVENALLAYTISLPEEKLNKRKRELHAENGRHVPVRHQTLPLMLL